MPGRSMVILYRLPFSPESWSLPVANRACELHPTFRREGQINSATRETKHPVTWELRDGSLG